MLRLFEYNARKFDNGQIAVLDEAAKVKVSQVINGDYSLSFEYPYMSDKSKMIKENMLVVCDGQPFRIMKLESESIGCEMLRVSCMHVYNADAPKRHIQSIGGTAQTIGASPSGIAEIALKGSGFYLIKEYQLNDMGMTWLGSDGFKIDFETTDKTNAYDVMQRIITNAGKGELFVDGWGVAIVESIGKDTGIMLDTTHNLKDVSVERDISDMITRLYPYGEDDAHIGSVNGGVQYIESANASVYGIREGYRDYSEYVDPNMVLNHALWEFDSANDDRIDVPSVNISGSLIDLSKLSQYGNIMAIKLGDRVNVIDHGNVIKERVTGMEYYPYEPMEASVSIGRIKKDLFFYLNQMKTLTKRYSNISTSTGKVSAQAIAGVVSSSAGVSVSSDTGAMSVVNEMITIMNKGRLRCRIGNLSANGEFVFEVYDNLGQKVISLDDNGCISSINMGGIELSVSEGDLCFDGKKILLEE